MFLSQIQNQQQLVNQQQEQNNEAYENAQNLRKENERFLLDEQERMTEILEKNQQQKEDLNKQFDIAKNILNSFPQNTKDQSINQLREVLKEELKEILKSQKKIQQHIDSMDQIQESQHGNINRLATHCVSKYNQAQEVNINIVQDIQELMIKDNQQTQNVQKELLKLQIQITKLQVETNQEDLIVEIQNKVRSSASEEEKKLENKIIDDRKSMYIEQDAYLEISKNLNFDLRTNEAFQKSKEQLLKSCQDELNQLRNFIDTVLPQELKSFKDSIQQDTQENVSGIEKQIKQKKEQQQQINEYFEKRLIEIQEQHTLQINSISELNLNQFKKLTEKDIKSKFFHYLLCLDHSGSIQNDFPQIVETVNQFASDRFAISQQDELSIVVFEDTATTLYEPQKIKQNYDIQPDKWGGTNFEAAFTEIQRNISLGNKSYTPVIIFMTDGDGTGNYAQILKKIKSDYEIRDVMLFCIGFGNNFNAAQLEKISSILNGSDIVEFRGKRFRPVKSAKNQDSLKKNFQEINQYFQEDNEAIQESIDNLNNQKQNLITSQKNEIAFLKENFYEDKQSIEQEIDQLQSAKNGAQYKSPQEFIAEKEQQTIEKKDKLKIQSDKVLENIKKLETEIASHKSQIDTIKEQIQNYGQKQNQKVIQDEQNILQDEQTLIGMKKKNIKNLEEIGFVNIEDYLKFLNNLQELEKLYTVLLSYCKTQIKFVNKQQQLINKLGDCIKDNLIMKENLINDDLQLFGYYRLFIEGIDCSKHQNSFIKICQYIFQNYEQEYSQYIGVLYQKIKTFTDLIKKCSKENSKEELIDAIIEQIMSDFCDNVDCKEKEDIKVLQKSIREIESQIQSCNNTLAKASREDKSVIKEELEDLKEVKKEKSDELKELQKDYKDIVKQKKKEEKKPIIKLVTRFIENLNQNISFVLTQLSKRNFAQPLIRQLSSSVAVLEKQSIFFNSNQKLLEYKKE